MKKTNYVEPYFYDLKNEYAIVEMSDEELSKSKKIDLGNWGLIYMDGQNDYNEVNGRIIDFGGIMEQQGEKWF